MFKKKLNIIIYFTGVVFIILLTLTIFTFYNSNRIQSNLNKDEKYLMDYANFFLSLSKNIKNYNEKELEKIVTDFSLGRGFYLNQYSLTLAVRNTTLIENLLKTTDTDKASQIAEDIYTNILFFEKEYSDNILKEHWFHIRIFNSCKILLVITFIIFILLFVVKYLMKSHQKYKIESK